MMASHRPDAPVAPPPPEPAPPAAPAGLTTLPHSNFLVGFDWVLALGVLTLAFLVASFAVRNSDFWMHLAAGRLLAEGSYQFGTDPFSYTDSDHTWVNHAWLFDWFLYQLFKLGDGPAVVIAKAVGIALTAGLLLLARKPGQSVFPGVVCAGLALLAAAPRLTLQPAVLTLLFLAALMFLLVRIPRRSGSWVFPGLVAGLFWLWVNCDQWFFLGPLALLLYTAGQYVRADEGEDVPSLWKALGIGVLATLLNPHHVRAWVPPAELVDGRLFDALGKDPEFADLFRGAFTAGAIDFTGERANPINLYALLALVALALVGFVVNRRQASVGLALVWAGALALALYHLRAVPFLAVVTAPVAAVNLAAAGRRLAATPLPDGTVRTLHALRGGGRAAVGLVGLLLIAISYPGWLHPFEQQRRWKWDVEPNLSMERAARKLDEWRAAGTLPPEARMLNLQPDFANYVAWYAPGEKTFFDYRVGFHRDRAAEYTALRRHLSYRDPQMRRHDPFNLGEFLTQNGIAFAVYTPVRADGRAMLISMWGAEDPVTGPEWVLWDVQGRAVTFGWARQRAIPTAAFDRLRLDPLRAAYAQAEPLPRPPDPVPPPPTATDVWERFLVSPPVAPVDAEEAAILHLYGQTLFARATNRHRWTVYGLQVNAHAWLRLPALGVLAEAQPVSVPPEVYAVAIQAVRAARRAVAASPDHPHGHYLLAQTYSDVGFPTVGDLKDIVYAASLARTRARVPDDPTQARLGFDVADLCRQLFVAHDRGPPGPPRKDLALDALKLMATYLRQDVQDREAALPGVPAESRDLADAELEDRRRQLTQAERLLKDREAEVASATVKYVNEAGNRATALERAAVARRYGLVREAITELRKAHEQFQKDLEARPDQALAPADLAAQLAVHAELIEQLWYDGRVEESFQILGTVDTPEVLREMESEAVRREYTRVRQQAMGLLFRGAREVPRSPYDNDPAGHFRTLRRALSIIVGDFERAAEVQTEGTRAVREGLDRVRQQYFPAGLPDPAALPDVGALQREMRFRPALAPVYFAQMVQVGKVVQFRSYSASHVQGQVALGLTYLEWGDVPRAVYHLRQADDAPGLTDPLPAQRMARDLVRAIERVVPARGAGP